MIFKLHYGLWYGGLVGIIPFMFNYAVEYSGATGTQHGILYTILPFVALLAKPIACSVADRYMAHRQCLLFFIIMTIIGFGSLAIYPFFPEWAKQHKDSIWIGYCLAALIGNTSMCVVNSIGDSLAINSCQRKGISYGQYRLWGPIGFGIFGSIWGIANEIPYLPKYTPGLLTLIAILLLDCFLIANWSEDEFRVVSSSSSLPESVQIEETSSSIPAPNYGSTNRIENSTDASGDMTANDERKQEQPSTQVSGVRRLPLLGQLIMKKKSVIVFIFMFTFCGVMTGIHWQFYYRYLEQVAKNDGQNFFLVATLTLPVQALGGELIFFMISGKILKLLGASFTLTICLFSFAARYLLYAYFVPNVSIYWVMLVELFQGPAFGLMYCVLTHQANHYSEKIDEFILESPDNVQVKRSLHATLQGILGASFEGLGLGLGAIFGGKAYDIAPILMWQIAGYSALAVASLYLIGTITSKFIRRVWKRTSSNSNA